jgi:hypothetical protein
MESVCSLCGTAVNLQHPIKICASTIFYNETCSGCGRKIRFERTVGTDEYVCTGERRIIGEIYFVKCPICDATLLFDEQKQRKMPPGSDVKFVYVDNCNQCNTQVMCEKNNNELSVVRFHTAINPNAEN